MESFNPHNQQIRDKRTTRKSELEQEEILDAREQNSRKQRISGIR